MSERPCVRALMGLALAVGTVALSACSSDSADPGPTDTATVESAVQTSDSPEPTPTTPSAESVPVPAGLVGTGCAAYATRVPMGPGSLDGMSPDPVAVAMANSPLLTTFSSALAGKLNSDVNFVDTLNGGQYTVFAPVDDAWGRVDPATVDKFRNDAALLTSVLNYHVVPGQLPPDQIVGEHKTARGAVLTVTGSGDELRVNNAAVICGGIRSANAVIYLIDTVMMPPPPAPSGAPTPGAPTSSTSSTDSATSSTSSTDSATSTTPTS